ncbi:hypothetical protein [Herbiconiux sp. UC225_62]|uniref:hypothetical protein n=1 Tax=Herbiconiux sp. UC225_62 TaxID=3350168 RepID=UPI0036D3A309
MKFRLFLAAAAVGVGIAVSAGVAGFAAGSSAERLTPGERAAITNEQTFEILRQGWLPPCDGSSEYCFTVGTPVPAEMLEGLGR